jgi:hypothetical protein
MRIGFIRLIIGYSLRCYEHYKRDKYLGVTERLLSGVTERLLPGVTKRLLP